MKYILAAIISIIFAIYLYRLTEIACDLVDEICDKWEKRKIKNWKIKKDIDLKELEKFGYKIIPERDLCKKHKKNPSYARCECN